jgi:hypothetical protein
MRTAERAVPFCCGIFLLLFAAAIPAGLNPAVAQALPQPKLTRMTVTISPLKATLFAGETQIFVASGVGLEPQTRLQSLSSYFNVISRVRILATTRAF